MAQSVWDPELSFVCLKPIAMAIRILPGALGLELCRVNRNQATLKFDQNHWFYIGCISVCGWHRSIFLGLGFRVLLFLVEPARARAIMAWQQGLRFLCSRNTAI